MNIHCRKPIIPVTPRSKAKTGLEGAAGAGAGCRYGVDWGGHIHPTFSRGCFWDWCKSGNRKGDWESQSRLELDSRVYEICRMRRGEFAATVAHPTALPLNRPRWGAPPQIPLQARTPPLPCVTFLITAFHHFLTVSLWAQNLPFQKILSSTLVCFCLSHWSCGSIPFTGLLCWSVLCFSSILSVLVIPTKTLSSLVNC